MQLLFIKIVLGLLLLVTGSAYSADLQQGLKAAMEKNYKLALEEWQPLASEGNPWAQYNLGHMYRQGHGVEANSAVAFTWYLKSAEQGLAVAQFAVGAAYSNADGVDQDYEEAASWFFLAAEQENFSAQYQLGRMHLYGIGVPQHFVKAHMWTNLASFYGEKNSIQLLQTIEAQLGSADIISAREMALLCVRTFFKDCGKEMEVNPTEFVEITPIFKPEKEDTRINNFSDERIDKLSGTFYTTASMLSVRSCAVERCGRLRLIPRGYKVIVVETRTGWARISPFYDALCADGKTPLVELGNKDCVAGNGIVKNKLAEWVSLDFLKRADNYIK